MTNDNKPSIGGSWDDFAALAVPDDAEPFQSEAMKLAFYSGARSVFRAFAGGDKNAAEVPGILRSFSDELDEFATDHNAKAAAFAHLEGLNK